MNIKKVISITLSDEEVLQAVADYVSNRTEHIIKDLDSIEIYIDDGTNVLSALVVIK